MKNSNTNRSFEHLSRKSCFRFCIPLVFLVFLFLNPLWAQRTAVQVLTFEVKAIAQLSVDGNPEPLVIRDVIPGQESISVSDNNTKYNLVTNVDNMKIVASINDPMPAGTKLMIKMASKNAVDLGPIDVSSAVAPVDLISGVRKGSESNQSISYIFSANADVSEISSQSRVVTFTLTN